MPRHHGAHLFPILALGLAIMSFGGCAFGGGQSVALARRVAPDSATQTPALAADPALCGAWSAADGATGQSVAARYGEISNCARVGGSWVIATEGLAGQPGVIGVAHATAPPRAWMARPTAA